MHAGHQHTGPGWEAIQGAQVSESQSIAANGGEYEFVQQVRVAKPNLWSPDNPYLYKVRSTVKERDRVVDEYDTVLGIRGIEFDVDKGFLLNGKQVKLNGVCLHHDGGSVGAAVPERVWERRLEILKAMGCNSIRTSHNPYSSDFMDLCDKLGFMVMNEIFDEWKQNKTAIRIRRLLRRMVGAGRNELRPSRPEPPFCRAVECGQ